MIYGVLDGKTKRKPKYYIPLNRIYNEGIILSKKKEGWHKQPWHGIIEHKDIYIEGKKYHYVRDKQHGGPGIAEFDKPVSDHTKNFTKATKRRKF